MSDVFYWSFLFDLWFPFSFVGLNSTRHICVSTVNVISLQATQSHDKANYIFQRKRESETRKEFQLDVKSFITTVSNVTPTNLLPEIFKWVSSILSGDPDASAILGNVKDFFLLKFGLHQVLREMLVSLRPTQATSSRKHFLKGELFFAVMFTVRL